MEEKERLKKQLDFILEVDKVKNIFRQTYLADGNRKENDAEHSWHLALMAVLLKEYSNEEVDLSKVIPMVLAHDLVEIDAGDTYAYDEKGAATKDARERKAADRIYGLLPEDQGQWLKALFAMLLSAYGFALGLSSFSEENRKHRTSMIGSILNGVILVIWLGLFLSGV